MTKGVYIRTEENKKNISKGRLKRKERLGFLNSPKTRKKISIKNKGKIPWNKGKSNPKLIGNKHKLGYVNSPRTRKLMSKSQKGRKSWNKGIPNSEATKRKQSLSMLKRKERLGYINSPEMRKKISGENNGNWKGKNAGYTALHCWVHRHKPKSKFCEKCGKITDKLDCSSINHTYKRDISEWRWLCKKCHKQIDGWDLVKKEEEK